MHGLNRRSARLAVAALGLFALVAVPAGARQAPAAGQVKVLSGPAIVIRAGQQVPAAVGLSVFQGDIVRTGAAARLGLTLKDGTRVSLGANTELCIDAFAYEPADGRLGIVLKLARGVLAYISGRIAQLAPGSVTIETPRSVIGVRGTHLLVGVDEP
jgi:hypothetical protein